MTAAISDIRVNGFDPSSIIVDTGVFPTISWNFVEDVESTAQAGFNIRIGSDDNSLGTGSFVGNRLNMTVTSSVPYFEYPEDNLVRGRRYYVQIRAWDNEYSGSGTGRHISVWNTFEFQVNSLPVVTSASIIPLAPTVADDLRLIYFYEDDDDQEESGTVIRWYNHNVLQDSFNDLIQVESRYLSLGDSWSVRISPCDGLEYGPTIQTQAVSVSATQVNIENISILPIDPNIDDLLSVQYSIFDDPYIDYSNSVTTYEWYVNGTQTSDSTQVVRLDLAANDVVYARVIVQDNDNILAEGTSASVTIADASWKVFDLKVGGMKEPVGLTELSPSVEWKRHKTKMDRDDVPNYLRIMVTKTPARASAVFDSGYTSYTKDSYQFQSDVFSRGKRYFVHVGAGDTQTFTDYLRTEVVMAGFSWSENVDNSIGWTIEFKARLMDDSAGQRQGIYVHDGTYFCSLFFSIENVDDGGVVKKASRITFTSDTTQTYDIIEPTSEEIFTTFQTYRITAMGHNAKVFLNNKEVLDLPNMLMSSSLLKQIDFGDLNPSATVEGVWRFIRYSTEGPYEIGSDLLDDANQFDFYTAASLPGGSIECMIDNAFSVPLEYRQDFPSPFVVSWTPDNESGKLFGFNENGETLTLPVATKNYSPITSIAIDKNRNKYMGTSNGVTVLYGSKHDADYSFSTDYEFTIPSSDFDLITNLPSAAMSLALTTDGSIGIDTTYQTLGVETNPEWNGEDDLDPYRISRGILYLAQRTHGQAWYDEVDNEKGWQVEFTLNIGLLEQDTVDDTDLDKEGVGVYISDGVRQEVIIFTRGTVTFLFANVSADLNTRYRRTIRIVGKGNDLKLYQRYASTAVGTEQLLINGTGLFTTVATSVGNSRNPRITLDSDGIYHAVWHDDGRRTSSIFYSKYDGSSWSNPEPVIESAPFSLKNPDIVTDSENKIYVVYEDLSYGHAEISASIRDTVGWNPKIRLTNYGSHKTKPKLTVDHSDNIHVVWEDYRNGKSEIFWCYRSKRHEAWQSSGQFGRDENIVSQNSADSNMVDKGMSFKNPAITYVYPRVYIAFEADCGDGTSEIYTSYYDTLSENWISSGYYQHTTTGIDTTVGISTRVSDTGRRCYYPDICGLSNQVVVVWEDQTEPISQIWGNSLFMATDSEFSGVTKITDRTTDCKNPSVGYVTSLSRALILFESQEVVAESTGSVVNPDTVTPWSEGTSPNADTGQIFGDFYSAQSGLYQGSATGYADELVFIENEKTAKHPHLPKTIPTPYVTLVYDYWRVLSDESTVSEEEHPKFWLIGDANTYVDSRLTDTSLDTRGIGTISSLYTKEFAIGDIDDRVGVQMNIRNISMYFGYDAKPLTVLNLNTDSIVDWPDNRVYDVFVDAYGNLLAATHGGLVYYDLSTGSVRMIEVEIEIGTGDSATTETLTNFVATAINYSRNGVWFIGTKDFSVYSIDGGQNWTEIKLDGQKITNVKSIAIDKNGSAVYGTSSGIYVVEIDFETQMYKNPIHIVNLTSSTGSSDDDVKVVKVDDDNIIWAGTDSGVIRIENHTNKTTADMRHGMRSNHVNDIAIVSRGTRYVATATGIEKMTGFTFNSINVLNQNIDSDNILSLNYYQDTKSLWFSATNKLYEMTFRDPERDTEPDETVEYESELLMDSSVDKLNHYILGLENSVDFQNGNFDLTSNSTIVTINKNQIDFGYSIDPVLQAVVFEVEPLDRDQIEVILSNDFKLFKDFTQNSVETDVLGAQTTDITKLVKTSSNQLLALSNLDVPSLMAYVGLSNLPLALVMLDREKPIGCLEYISQLNRRTLKLKVLASDQISGVADMVVSNYENFTTNGTTPQTYQTYEQYVSHTIDENLNETITEFTFPSTAVINATTYNVGTGKVLGTLEPADQSNTYVYAFTTKPVVIFRLDSAEEEWTAIGTIDSVDANTEAHSALTVNEVMFLTTGSDSGVGKAFMTLDGRAFTLIGSGGHHFYCAVASDDGRVFFGSDEGNIYEYSLLVQGQGSGFTRKFTGLGQKVLGLEYSNNTLFVATENTGTTGCGFQINLTTDDIAPMFPRSVTSLTDIKIINEDIFVSTGDSKEIWRSSYISGEQLDFNKSYSAVETASLDVYKVPTEALVDDYQKNA